MQHVVITKANAIRGKRAKRAAARSIRIAALGRWIMKGRGR